MNPKYWSPGTRIAPPGNGRLAVAVAMALLFASCGLNWWTAAAPAPVPATAPAGPAVSDAAIADARAELADKFLQAAERILHAGIPGEHQWQQGAALLQSACTLNPSEPSYPRLLAEAWRQLGDNDQVISALAQYRAAGLRAHWPDDHVAETELIDRYLVRMETVDQKLKYLRDVLAMPSLTPQVKAHVAVLSVPLLAQRSDTEAEGMIRQAIRLDPLNLAARRLQYETVVRGGSPLERIEVLLAMLRSNPAQRNVIEELARQLSQAGLHEAALDWYRGALIVSDRAGVAVDNSTMLDFAAQCYAAGQYADADALVSRVIEVSLRDPNAWFMRLAFDRTNPKPEKYSEYEQELGTAKIVFITQAVNVAKKILGPVRVVGPASEPATKPATEPSRIHTEVAGFTAEQVDSILQRIRNGEAPPGTVEMFVSAASDVAWFHLYFEEAPAEAGQWVKILREIVPPNDVRIMRLQGWLDLTTGNYAQAQAELAPIQDIDPLAGIGIVRLTAQGLLQTAAPATQPAAPTSGPATTRPATGLAMPATAPAAAAEPPQPNTAEQAANFEKADVIAKRLMARNPTGLGAAMVWAAVRERKLQLDPRPDAPAIRAELAKFPAQWVHIIENPEQFYLVIGKPVKLTHKIGEPMLGLVTLQNKSPFPITVGPEGVITPDLFFDVWLGMDGAKEFPRAAYDRIANVLVLQPREQSVQVVRLDQGPIVDALREKPATDVAMYAKVSTNPVARRGEIVPGPGGIRRDFVEQFVRKNSAMTDNIQEQKVMAGMEPAAWERPNGPPPPALGTAQRDERGPTARMMTLDALCAYVMAARLPNADGRTLALAPELTDSINRARTDLVPDVAAWATYLAMQIAKPEDKPKLVADLANSHDWEIRLLGGVAAAELPPEQQRPIVELLAHDTRTEIATFGAATAQDLSRPTSRPSMAIQRPGTVPATAPTSAPSRPGTGVGTPGR